jgi:hypothetical protein
MNAKNQNGEEFLASDRLLKNFIAQTPVSIQTHSTDGMLIDFNSALAYLFSLSDAIKKIDQYIQCAGRYADGKTCSNALYKENF